MVVQEGDRAAGWVKLCSRQVRLPPEDRVVPDHCWTLGDAGPATNRAQFSGKDVERNSVTSPNPNTLAKASWLKWIPQVTAAAAHTCRFWKEEKHLT